MQAARNAQRLNPRERPPAALGANAFINDFLRSLRVAKAGKENQRRHDSRQEVPAEAEPAGHGTRHTLLHSLDVARFGGVHLDLVAGADKGRHVHHQAGFQLGRLHHRAGGGFLNGLFGFDYSQIHGIG
jgi:hypothetical protein